MRVTLRSGFPIRKSTDQSLLAAPHGLSQRVTSFIASQRQGIHQMPLETLDQTAHKGKCHWKPVTATDAPALQAHFAGLLTPDRKALFRCNHAIPRSWMSSLTLSKSVPWRANPSRQENLVTPFNPDMASPMRACGKAAGTLQRGRHGQI